MEGDATVCAVTRAMSHKHECVSDLRDKADQDSVMPVSLDADCDDLPVNGPLVNSSSSTSEVGDEADEQDPSGLAEVESLDSTPSVEVSGMDTSVLVEDDVDLGCPTLVDNDDVTKLKAEIAEDDTLKHCKKLADSGMMGYMWKEGLLFHRVVDASEGACERLVLPKVRRQLVVSLAHDKSSHLGSKKVRDLINTRFTWPGLGVDVNEYVKSCETCLTINKAGNKQAKMVERPIISEPFESVAIDLVGLKGKEEQGLFLCLFALLADGQKLCP